jgi:hypothetical protein
MVDADFREELLTFLTSKNETMSLTPSACEPWSSIRARLTAAMDDGFIEQQKITAAERRLAVAIENVSLEVRRGSDGSLTLVTAMDLYSYFRRLDGPDSQKLYEATFGAAKRASARISQLALKQELVSELETLPKPLVLRGFTYDDPRILRVQGPAGESEGSFLRTSNGEHSGWCMPQGFALTASKRKQEGSVWVHELRAFADPEEDIDLTADDTLMNFLLCCEPGARLNTFNFRDRPRRPGAASPESVIPCV